MAGTLEITDELCWMPAGWVYDKALESIASCISDSEVEAILLGARTEENGGYLDLRDADAGLISVICDGATEAYRRLQVRGATGFAMPGFYDGFMQQFQSLLEMLEIRMRS